MTNKEVFEKIREKKTPWNNLKKRRAQMIGHSLRHEGYFRRRSGKERERGMPRMEYFPEAGYENFREVKDLVRSRIKCSRVASNQS